MESGALALLPVVVLIVGVLITRRMLEMLFISSALAAILMYKTEAFWGYLEMMNSALADETYELILFILFGVGAMIELFQVSGAMDAFGNAVGKFANNAKKSIVATWGMGVIMFFDDYLNTLCTTFSMREITDRNKVPREHLAYTASSMGASLCVLVPFTSWSAFAMATAGEYGINFGSYVQSIPFMFLPITAVLCALLVALGVVPKVGLLKKGYERVLAGGPVNFPGDKFAVDELVDTDVIAKKPVHPINFFLPLVVLVVVMVFMDNTMQYGIIAALLTQLVMYTAQRIMTVREFLATMVKGFENFVELAFTILLAYMTAATCLDMGMADFIIAHVVATVPAWMLPGMIFVAVGLLGCTADSWVITVLTVPIFLPMATEAGIGN